MPVTACTEDTDSVDLEFDEDGNLTASVRHSAVGTTETDSPGIQVRFGDSSGLTSNASGLALELQGPNLTLGSAGLQHINNWGAAGWYPGAADDFTTHNFTIARGSATAFSGLAVPLALTGTAANSFVYIYHYCSGVLTTTFSEFEPSAFNDETGIRLEGNYDNAGWVIEDRANCFLFRQTTAFKLWSLRAVAMSSSTAHSFQSRLVVTGGIASATANQGKLYQTFHRGIQYAW